MKAPPLLLGAAILLWGWQNGLLPLAAFLAASLEASRIVTTRWDLKAAEFNRIADFCSLLFLGTAVYLVSTKGMPLAVITLFAWMPLVFLPLVAAQIFSGEGAVNAGALFFILRKKAGLQASAAKVNLTYPYFALCLLSASAANTRVPQFYPALVALCAWALWFARSRRFPPLLWAGLLLCVAALGHAGHIGLHRLQGLVEDATQEWLTGGDGGTDPYQATTALGHIGKLKLSNKIVLRVDTGNNSAQPFLLHEASYDTYSSAVWSARDAAFTRIPPPADGATWTVQHGEPGDSMAITAYLRRGKGLLALPNGTVRVADLQAREVRQNRLGTLEFEQEAGTVTYRAWFAQAVSTESSPTSNDLKISAREARVISDLTSSLRLAEHSRKEIPGLIQKYFRENFRYSIFGVGHDRSSSPLADFLLKTKSGHCEYFATATTLLLRAAGIPARYAVGYSVQEFSKLENQYVARSRHAHAWTRVYLDGAWQDLDATPASWFAAEEENAPLWEPVSDVWRWAALRFAEWRESGATATTGWIGWAILPLLAFLAWRLHRKKRVAAGGGQTRSPPNDARQGEDSEFYLIERCLAGSGYGMAPGESLEQWLDRLRLSALNRAELDALSGIVGLHQRYRFDPAAISAEDRGALKEESRAWLTVHCNHRSSLPQGLAPPTR